MGGGSAPPEEVCLVDLSTYPIAPARGLVEYGLLRNQSAGEVEPGAVWYAKVLLDGFGKALGQSGPVEKLQDGIVVPLKHGQWEDYCEVLGPCGPVLVAVVQEPPLDRVLKVIRFGNKPGRRLSAAHAGEIRHVLSVDPVLLGAPDDDAPFANVRARLR